MTRLFIFVCFGNENVVDDSSVSKCVLKGKTLWKWNSSWWVGECLAYNRFNDDFICGFESDFRFFTGHANYLVKFWKTSNEGLLKQEKLVKIVLKALPQFQTNVNPFFMWNLILTPKWNIQNLSVSCKLIFFVTK